MEIFTDWLTELDVKEKGREMEQLSNEPVVAHEGLHTGALKRRHSEVQTLLTKQNKLLTNKYLFYLPNQKLYHNRSHWGNS